jgi:hypothetical protein
MTSTADKGLSTINIVKEIDIDAPLSVAFAAMLEQLGPASTSPMGPMPMKLEAWPGGRWYRDLGNNSGHFWGNVQVIKAPNLLEFSGPMFMSYPVASHVQFRLTEHGGATRLTMTHRAFGEITTEHREGVVKGWGHIVEAINARALGKR